MTKPPLWLTDKVLSFAKQKIDKLYKISFWQKKIL
jgi:hypothetical protein